MGACPEDTGTGGLVNTLGQEGVKVKLDIGQVPRLLMIQVGGEGGVCWQSTLPSSECMVLGNVRDRQKVRW